MILPLYPIKFIPIFKEKVWGGKKLKTLLGKQFKEDSVGESWEISGVENEFSVVENGLLKGNTIIDLIQKFKTDFLGEQVYKSYGTQFPLLFKFIDANEALSVQLHPDDKLAKLRHNSFGKTEMWYIIQADTDAELILGFNKTIDKQRYLEYLNSDQLPQILHREKVRAGDTFLIDSGLVHAIGAGVLLAEIQQTSDITYRIYDWNRPDVDGKMRALHSDLALDAIDFNPAKPFKLSAKKDNLVENAYFSVNQIKIEQHGYRDLALIDSFVVYMCVSGETNIECGGVTESLKMGETVLIPARAEMVHFQNGSAKLLEIFVP